MDIERLHRIFLDCGQVSTDSRSVQKGDLFVALKGANFDGNKFVSDVLDKGAKYAMASDPALASDRTLIVDDTLVTLQALAKYHRSYLDVPVIAITGSNGKTTTKELLTQVLNLQYKVHATKGNFNNHIGVPLTILQADKTTELMIIEMGANHLHEIDFLCNIAMPDYGLITNVGRAHIEGFGSYEGVITAKTEMYRHLRQKGKLIFYNDKDQVLVGQLPDGARAVPYLAEVEFDESSFLLAFANHQGQAKRTQLVGSYNKDNILAALTVGHYFDIPLPAMKAAICQYTPKNNRSQVVIKSDVTLILDAYNANPTSMESSIKSLAETETNSNKALILGDMKELGPDSVMMHRQVLDFAEPSPWKAILIKASRSLRLELVEDLLD